MAYRASIARRAEIVLAEREANDSLDIRNDDRTIPMEEEL